MFLVITLLLLAGSTSEAIRCYYCEQEINCHLNRAYKIECQHTNHCILLIVTDASDTMISRQCGENIMTDKELDQLRSDLRRMYNDFEKRFPGTTCRFNICKTDLCNSGYFLKYSAVLLIISLITK